MAAGTLAARRLAVKRLAVMRLAAKKLTAKESAPKILAEIGSQEIGSHEISNQGLTAMRHVNKITHVGISGSIILVFQFLFGWGGGMATSMLILAVEAMAGDGRQRAEERK